MKKFLALILIICITQASIIAPNAAGSKSGEEDEIIVANTRPIPDAYNVSNSPVWIMTIRDNKSSCAKLPVIEDEYGEISSYEYSQRARNGIFIAYVYYEDHEDLIYSYAEGIYVLNTNKSPITYAKLPDYIRLEDFKIFSNNVMALKYSNPRETILFDANTMKEIPLSADYGVSREIPNNGSPYMQTQRYFFNAEYSSELKQYFLTYDRYLLDDNGDFINKKASVNIAVFNEEGDLIKRIPLRKYYYAPEIRPPVPPRFLNGFADFRVNSQPPGSLYLGGLYTMASIKEFYAIFEEAGNRFDMDTEIPSSTPLIIDVDSGEFVETEYVRTEEDRELPYIVEYRVDGTYVLEKEDRAQVGYLKGSYILYDFSANDDGSCSLVFAPAEDAADSYVRRHPAQTN